MFTSGTDLFAEGPIQVSLCETFFATARWRSPLPRALATVRPDHLAKAAGPPPTEE